jgi:hypothetical protein
MENNGLSSNEKKVLARINECVKVDIPALAEKTGLSKPTVRAIVNKLNSSQKILPSILGSPSQMGLGIMTVYEATYPACYDGGAIEKYADIILKHSNNCTMVIKINPSQAIVLSFYKDLEQKDKAFAKTMSYFNTVKAKDFNPVVKELWTRPAKDFIMDMSISKFFKASTEFESKK